MNKILLLISLYSLVFSYYRYYTTKIDNKEFTFKTKDFIEEDTVIDYSIISAENIDDVCVLITEGRLSIHSGVTISKIVPQSNVNNFLKDNEDNFNESDNYIYGLTSCIVAIGENTKVIIENIIIYIDSPFSNVIVALNGAKIYLKNTTIITTKKYSKGISSLNKGFVDISQDSNITTIGDYSPCLEINKKEGRIDTQYTFLFTKGKESPLMNNFGDGKMEIDFTKGVAENSQILVIGGTNYVSILDCEFSCNGNIINNNNLNNGGIVLFNNDESNNAIANLLIYSSSLAINNKNANISMFSCYNIEAEINLVETNIKIANIFMKTDKTENSTIETKIILSVEEIGIEGKIMAKNNTEIILLGDKDLFNIETEGKVQFEEGLFYGIFKKKNNESKLNYLFILSSLIILIILIKLMI